MNLSDTEIKDIVERNPLAFATISNKKPYVIGILYCKVVNDQIIITDVYMNSTIKNIRKNNNVALVGWDKIKSK